MSDIAVLNHAEQVALEECERVIGDGIKTFVAVGSSLAFVLENRLYRGTHQTFEAYARERWSLSRPRAYQLMEAADVVSNFLDTDQAPPLVEAQARELAKVPEPERAEVWRETVERTEGKPTAAAVRETVKRAQAPAPAAAEGPAQAEPDAEATERHADLDAQLDAAMEGTPQRFRRNFSAVLARSDDVWQFDPDRIAEVYAGDFDQAIRPFLREMHSWCEAVAAAHRRNSGLRVVGGKR